MRLHHREIIQQKWQKQRLRSRSFENGFNFLFDVILRVLAFGGVPLVLAVHLEAYMFGQADHPCHSSFTFKHF